MAVHTSSDLSIRSTSSRWGQSTFQIEHRDGNGFTVEGKLVELRNHSVCDQSGKYHRFLSLVVDVSRSRIRVFTDKGEERDPQHNPEDKVQRKGYLNVYHKVDSGDPFQVDDDSLQKAIGSASAALPDGYFDLQASKLHPKVPRRFEFWGDSLKLKYRDLHLKPGSGVIIRTKGNSIFVDEVAAKESAGSASFASENAGANWTEKIFAHKSDQQQQQQEEETKGTGDACEDD
eukprot:CAMPEP_0201475498 /NCGR_PEP_ID=MMETSP0151_2-20130828/926_1 /ASSEMBLY_ACC=CAM_ASM_000257 /TAXON_ID=200890 /ORGANISM="Paramoeba atlantica, Strain 621/1 / CCAP 1560/9" /LENGTH=231 /DNA_ID=CAMNT_0047855609 /DNA_START=13 /DNA_END=705 /DNA_ORIENTATION=-